MRHIRFSVAALLVAMAVLALGLAALESSWPGTSSLAFTIHLMLLGIALVGAIVNGGNRRVFWLGSAVFAWCYSLVAFGILFPGGTYNSNVWWVNPVRASSTRHELFTQQMLDWYESLRVRRDVGSPVSAQWHGGGYWPGVIRKVHENQYLIAWDDGSPAEWVGASQVQSGAHHLDSIGHSLFSPLFGLMGGVICWYCFADRRVTTPQRAT